jgi:hypothetical protein
VTPSVDPALVATLPGSVEAIELVELPGLVEPRFQRPAAPFKLIESAQAPWRCVAPHHFVPRPLGQIGAMTGSGHQLLVGGRCGSFDQHCANLVLLGGKLIEAIQQRGCESAVTAGASTTVTAARSMRSTSPGPGVAERVDGYRRRLLAAHRHPQQLLRTNEVIGVLGVVAQVDLDPADPPGEDAVVSVVVVAYRGSRI